MENKTIFTEIGKWNDRLEMFGYDIMSLISLGESERVDDIISHFEDGDVVRYIMNKYKENMTFVYEGCPYNINDWEEVFEQYSYMTYGHDVRRKMGLIDKEKDGLLLLLSIILDEVSNRKYK